MFSAGSFAKIWEIKEDKGKYTDIRISTSRKNKDTGEYEQDFGGYVRMVGKAHDLMAHLEEGDRFKIVRCGAENHYNKEKKVTYYNFVIFEAEADDSYPESGESSDSDEENPFI
jgi:hypothetical protein